MKKEFNVLDLFCGAGGLSTGFQKAGYNILMGIDHDQKALETFQVNHPRSRIICGDMRKIKTNDILEDLESKEIDVIIGGPPCQGFSMAGKRRPNDPRNSLFKEYLRLVKDIKPKAFIMENVKGLLSMKNEHGRDVIDIILGEFRKIEGYNVELFKVNSADYGVPQRRQRIFIIGIKEGYNFSFPIPTHTKDPQNSQLKKWVGVKEVLIKKEFIPKKYFYSEKLIRGFKRREILNKKNGIGFGWQFNNPDIPSYTISARYWKDGAESLIRYDEKTIRMFTPKECALIQSFPKDYKFVGNENEIYMQIGNAVPPLMAEKIANALKSAFNYNGILSYSSFNEKNLEFEQSFN